MWILAFLALSPHAGAAPAAHMHDAAFREGWSLLQEERYVEARAALGKIPPAEYDLGDYIAYFVGMGAARDGKRSEAGESLRTLEEKFPDSPLLPYLHHEVAYAAALDNDVAGARMALERSHGKVGGGYRKSEEGFVAAFLAEEGGPSPEARVAAPFELRGVHGARGGGPLLRAALEMAPGGTLRRVGPVAGVLCEVRQGGHARRGTGTGACALRRGGPPVSPLGGLLLPGPGLRRVPQEAGGDHGRRRTAREAAPSRAARLPVGGPLPSRPRGVEGGTARGGAHGVPEDRGGGRASRDIGAGPVPRGMDRGGRGGPRGSYAVVRAAPGRPGRRDPAGGALPVRLRPVPDRPARRGDRRVRSGGKGRVRHGGGRAASVLEGAGATRCRQGDGGGAGLRGTGRGRGRAGLRALRGVGGG